MKLHYGCAMARQTIEIRADELGETLASHLSEIPSPSERVRVTVESMPDYSDVPDDILENQKEGLRSRMASGDRATDEEVKSLFNKWA